MCVIAYRIIIMLGDSSRLLLRILLILYWAMVHVFGRFPCRRCVRGAAVWARPRHRGRYSRVLLELAQECSLGEGKAAIFIKIIY